MERRIFLKLTGLTGITTISTSAISATNKKPQEIKVNNKITEEKIVIAVNEYFNNLIGGRECNEFHDFQGEVIKIIKKVFEDKSE